MSVMGYSKMIASDRDGTIAVIKSFRTLAIHLTEKFGGRVVDTSGDAILAVFNNAAAAVDCAVAIQKRPVEEETSFLKVRIGLSLGDIMEDEGTVYGNDINIAARLEALAPPGGICMSRTVREAMRGKIDLDITDLGFHRLKNIPEKHQLFSWHPEGPQVIDREMKVLEQASWLPLPGKPSLVVLPFENMSDNLEQGYFSDGISEDISTDLSKISALFVIARNSAVAYKNREVQVQEVSRELGVRYVVEGSVRTAGNRVRITAQLIDGRSGGHLWAERYDRELTDVFDLQDEIREKIVDALQLKLTEGEREQVNRRYTKTLEAYDLYLRGRDLVRASNMNNAKARDLFEKAIKLDPSFASAYAQLSYCHFRDWFNQWSQNSRKLEHAFEAAQKAVNIDRLLPEARAFLAWANLWKRNHERAVAEGKSAITLDPNFAEGYARLGEIFNLAGRPEEGVNLIKKAMRLDPHYLPIYLFYLGQGYYAMGKYEEAISNIKRAVARNPDYLDPHRTLAVIFSELDRKEEAEAQVAEILRINPYATVENQRDRLPFQDQVVAELYLENLRKAGLPA